MGCAAGKEQRVEDGKAAEVPKDFPAGVEARRALFENWDASTIARDVLQCDVKNEDEVVSVVNWAVKNEYTVRATGIKHNWSPITIPNVGPKASLEKVVLISLMKYMKAVKVTPAADGKPAAASVQLGCRQIDFLTALEKAEGGTPGIGYGIVHCPAPDSITVGGMLAIDGHGTAIATADEAKIIEPATANYGTYSNLMLSCRAVVYDEAKKEYAVKEFKRENGDEIAPFLAHVGNALMTEATLQVIPNYFMRCVSRLDLSWKTLFPKSVDPANPPVDSMAYFVRQTGRAEAIWFPFTENPWMKIWTVTDDKLPEGSTRVDKALNYPFSDNLPETFNRLFRSLVGADEDAKDKLLRQIHQEELDAARKKAGKPTTIGQNIVRWFDDVATDIADKGVEVIGGPELVKFINKMLWLRVSTGLLTSDSDDIWGPSKNTLIYVADETLRVTANGYVIMTTLDHIQEIMHIFATLYESMLAKYASRNQFPIACPLEIRVTGVDDPTPIGGPGLNAKTVPLSALHYDEADKAKKWDVALWLDVLSLPGTMYSNEFYAEMEHELMSHAAFNGVNARIRPEWSKGWGYTNEGPWRSEQFRDHTRKGLPQWNAMMAEFRKHDPKRLYTNEWMSKFFVDVEMPAAPAAPAVVAKDTLKAGEQLTVGDKLVSTNGAYELVLQTDGNLVLYEAGVAVWASNTAGQAATHAAVDAEGKLVILNAGTAIWDNGAAGAADKLVVQNDRNVVTYAADGAAVWATNTVKA